MFHNGPYARRAFVVANLAFVTENYFSSLIEILDRKSG